ncbi:MAG: hypothetical protein IT332_13650 [Ardenticatenales bacterium]|nr:hypothetical protein [Ardenticatenales bacterium]
MKLQVPDIDLRVAPDGQTLLGHAPPGSVLAGVRYSTAGDVFAPVNLPFPIRDAKLTGITVRIRPDGTFALPCEENCPSPLGRVTAGVLDADGARRLGGRGMGTAQPGGRYRPRADEGSGHGRRRRTVACDVRRLQSVRRGRRDAHLPPTATRAATTEPTPTVAAAGRTLYLPVARRDGP